MKTLLIVLGCIFLIWFIRKQEKKIDSLLKK